MNLFRHFLTSVTSISSRPTRFYLPHCRRFLSGFLFVVFILLYSSTHSQGQESLSLGNVATGTTAIFNVSFTFEDPSGQGLPYLCAGETLTGADRSDFAVSTNFIETQFSDGQIGYCTIAFAPSRQGLETVTNTFSFSGAWFYFNMVWVITGTGTPPTAVISSLRVTANQADLTPPTDLRTPIVPSTDVNSLGSAQVPLGAGVVADGVTPVLFAFQLQPGNYSLDVTVTDVSSSGSVTYNGGSLLTNLCFLVPRRL